MFLIMCLFMDFLSQEISLYIIFYLQNLLSDFFHTNRVIEKL